jgi:hypothetical protein
MSAENRSTIKKRRMNLTKQENDNRITLEDLTVDEARQDVKGGGVDAINIKQ